MSQPEILEQRKNIGRIIKAARMFYGITQMDMADILNVNQSTISKIEKGILEPGIFGWNEFLNRTKIKNTECYKTGYLEVPMPNLNTNQINESRHSGDFKLPAKYAKSKNITVRKIIPLIELLDKRLGETAFNQFAKSKKIKREYFYILNNPLNTTFEIDLMEFILQKDIVKSLKELSIIQNPKCHGILSKKYQDSKSPKMLIEYFIKKQNEYGIDFSYSLHELDHTNRIIIEAMEKEVEFKHGTPAELIDCYREYNLYFPYNLQNHHSTPYLLGDNCSYLNGKGTLELVA